MNMVVKESDTSLFETLIEPHLDLTFLIQTYQADRHTYNLLYTFSCLIIIDSISSTAHPKTHVSRFTGGSKGVLIFSVLWLLSKSPCPVYICCPSRLCKKSRFRGGVVSVSVPKVSL